MSPTPAYPRDVPPVWLLLALACIWLLHWLAPGPVLIAAPWTWLGYALAALSLAFMVGAALLFRRLGTGVRPFSPATMLVAQGPFRFTRNPMYLGMVGLVTGIAFGVGSAMPLLVPPLFFALLDRRFVRNEERFLRERFGSAYDDYCRRVRRWL